MSKRCASRILGVLVLMSNGGFSWGGVPPSAPTYDVRIVKTSIPMKDGVRLAVTLYMPDGPGTKQRFPALLEYLPYRKDDGTAVRDYGNHAYFAKRGFVGARVDIRGFGMSEVGFALRRH